MSIKFCRAQLCEYCFLNAEQNRWLAASYSRRYALRELSSFSLKGFIKQELWTYNFGYQKSPFLFSNTKAHFSVFRALRTGIGVGFQLNGNRSQFEYQAIRNWSYSGRINFRKKQLEGVLILGSKPEIRMFYQNDKGVVFDSGLSLHTGANLKGYLPLTRNLQGVVWWRQNFSSLAFGMAYMSVNMSIEMLVEHHFYLGNSYQTKIILWPV